MSSCSLLTISQYCSACQLYYIYKQQRDNQSWIQARNSQRNLHSRNVLTVNKSNSEFSDDPIFGTRLWNILWQSSVALSMSISYQIRNSRIPSRLSCNNQPSSTCYTHTQVRLVTRTVLQSDYSSVPSVNCNCNWNRKITEKQVAVNCNCDSNWII